MRKRLLYVLHSYFDRAGTEEHTRALAKGLAGRFQVFVLFPENQKLWLTADGRNFKCFPAQTTEFYWSIQPASAPITLKSLGAAIRHVDPDILHIQHLAGWSLDALEFLNATGLPRVMSIHDYYCVTPAFIVPEIWSPKSTVSAAYARETFGQDLSGYLQTRRKILDAELPKIDRFIVPSKHLDAEIQRVFPLTCSVMPHGIPEFPRPVRSPQPAAFVFAFLGNLLPHKGWRSLVHAFQHVRACHPDAELHFHGQTKGVRSIRQDGVFLCGPYTSAQLPDIFRRVDVVIIPSTTAETFSLALSEAWMAGRPVAASRLGALAERITHRVSGILFEPGNPASIAQALNWFLETDEWKLWSYPEPKTLGQMCDDYAALYMNLL